MAPRTRGRLVVALVGLGAATLTLGFVGLGGLDDGWDLVADPVRLTDLLFRSAALLVLEQSAGDPAYAVWFAAARTTALLFVGIAALGVIFAFSSQAWELVRRTAITRGLRRPARSGPVVVLGLGSVGAQVARELRGSRPVVAVELDVEAAGVHAARKAGALVLPGDARDHSLRRRALLEHAWQVIIACGDDGLNLELAYEIIEDFGSGRLRRKRGWPWHPEPGRLECHVHVSDPVLSAALLERAPAAPERVPVDLSVFNTLRSSARELLVHEERGLATRYAPSPDEVPYYVIFGFGLMGQSAALQIARLAHFPGQYRPRMTIVEEEIEAARDRFLASYPAFAPEGGVDLQKHIDLPDQDKDGWRYRGYRVPPAWRVPPPDVSDEELSRFYGSVERACVARHAVEYVSHAEFLAAGGRPEAPALVELLVDRMRRSQRPRVRPAIVLAFSDERRNLQAALAIRDRLQSLGSGRVPEPVPLFVHLEEEEGLWSLLQGTDSDPRFPLHAFGRTRDVAMHRNITRPVLGLLARSIHLSYHRRGDAGGPVSATNRSWEEAERLWADARPWERIANLEAADHTVAKLRSLGFTFRAARDGEKSEVVDLSSLAPVEHNRWLAEKLLASWRCEPYPEGYETLSEAEKRRVRNEEMAPRKRRAPLVPWGEHLLEEDKQKDRAQLENLLWALEHAGQVVVPYSEGGTSR